METREGNEIIKCGHGDCHVLCIFMIVNERRKWYNKKEFEFRGGEENGSILTIKKYLST